MITFRTAYYPTQDADMEKLDNAPMEYNEALEVEYDPSRALSLQDSNTEESYGLQQTNGNGANVATGVVVGAAAGATVFGASNASASRDDGVDDFSHQAGMSQQTGGSQQDIHEFHPGSFGDANWLDDIDASAPVAPQY